MKFPYRPFPVQFDADAAVVTVYRPIVSVAVIGPQGKTTIRALADSGADCSIFSLEVAERIGVELQLDRPTGISGIGEAEMEFYVGEVELSLHQGKDDIRWKTTALFGPIETNILGQLGFFEFFTISFDHLKRAVELLPNARIAAG